MRANDLRVGRHELVGRANRESGNLMAFARAQRPGSAQLRSSAIEASGPAGGLTAASGGTESATFEVVLEALCGYDPFNCRIARISTIVAESDFRYVYDGWREVGHVRWRRARQWNLMILVPLTVRDLARP